MLNSATLKIFKTQIVEMPFRHSKAKVEKDNFGRLQENQQNITTQDMYLKAWLVSRGRYLEGTYINICTCHRLLHDWVIYYNFIYILFLWRKPAKRPQNIISTITKASVPHLLEWNMICIKASLASTCIVNYQLN